MFTGSAAILFVYFSRKCDKVVHASNVQRRRAYAHAGTRRIAFADDESARARGSDKNGTKISNWRVQRGKFGRVHVAVLYRSAEYKHYVR